MTDDGVACGLSADYESVRRQGKDDRDQFQLHLIDIVDAAMGGAAAARLSVQFHTIDGADVCRVHVQPSPVPVDATVTVDLKGQLKKKTAFYVRNGNSSRELDDAEKAKYVLGRWPGPLATAGAA